MQTYATTTKKPNAMVSLLNTEQSEGSEFITFILSNEITIDVAISDLEKFIEAEGINVELEYGGNIGIGEPWLDLDNTEVVVNPSDYLDSHLDSVCQIYFSCVISPRFKSKTLLAIESKLEELDAEDRLAIKDGDVNKSILLSSMKCLLMDVRVVLGQELGLIREAV